MEGDFETGRQLYPVHRQVAGTGALAANKKKKAPIGEKSIAFSFFIGGLNVMKGSENYALRRYPKGVVVYIALKDSPEIFNELLKKIRKEHSIEVFFKSEKQSAKFLLGEFL